VDEKRLRDLLALVKTGDRTIDEAASELRRLPFADLGFAMVDHHRALRQGVPEVILAEGKTSEQIVAIARELGRTGQNVLITRIDEAHAAIVVREIHGMRYSRAARMCTLEQAPIVMLPGVLVAIVCAGTSDLPVAEECAETMRMLGVRFERVIDVGVAGLHRLLSKQPVLEKAGVIVVIAGMEGALASVVGGLVDVPVIAVPTSTGYGAAFGGITAMCAMMASCTSGITVVNIDNGFGAAFATVRILRAQGRITRSDRTGKSET